MNGILKLLHCLRQHWSVKTTSSNYSNVSLIKNDINSKKKTLFVVAKNNEIIHHKVRDDDIIYLQGKKRFYNLI